MFLERYCVSNIFVVRRPLNSAGRRAVHSCNNSVTRVTGKTYQYSFLLDRNSFNKDGSRQTLLINQFYKIYFVLLDSTTAMKFIYFTLNNSTQYLLCDALHLYAC